MKVFDYTGGKKGKLLGDIARPSWMAGCYRDRQILGNADTRYEFHTAAGRSNKARDDTPINVSDFGVEAICFCIGQERPYGSHEQGEWKWATLYTDAGLERALADGTVVVKGRVERQKMVITGLDIANREAVEAALRLLHGAKTEIFWRSNNHLEAILDHSVWFGTEDESSGW